MTLMLATGMPDFGPRAAAGLDLPCHQEDPDLFFAESPLDVERAKQVCIPCPVRQLCLQGALDRQEPWGVWGGELFQAGVVVAFKRGRGRPPKTHVA